MKKIIQIAGIILLALVLIQIIIYVTDRQALDLPLKEAIFEYKGKYITKGSGKPITMVAPPHYIEFERVFEKDGLPHLLLAFTANQSRDFAVILVKKEDGFYLKNGKDMVLVIPREVKRGQKWEINMGSEIITARVGKSRKIETGLGQYESRELFFQNQSRARVRIWIHQDVGITALHYSYLGGGPSRNEADLVLKSIKGLDK
ncbi:MAG: hypothetical protein ACLFQV_08885 [Vulcanimicrobiota bacterium]